MPTLLQSPTPNRNISLDYYRKLNFSILRDSPLLVSDGKVIIHINEDRYARAGLKISASNKIDWDNLQRISTIVEYEGGNLCPTPSGMWVYIEDNLKSLPEIPDHQSVLGNSSGLCLESTDLAKSLQLWLSLGFELKAGKAEGGWLSLINEDGFEISIMKVFSCPHMFFNPSLCYFNGKEGNPKVIARIRELNIPITEEITHFNKDGEVDNIIVRDPGGVGFFVFND